MYGKTLAFSADRPLIGVNHLEGHLFAPTLEDPELEPPFIGLLVSGGHTMLLDVPAWGEYRLLGQTLDDAAGEAFDKVANLLGLGYPGGAAIERLARDGTARPLSIAPADAAGAGARGAQPLRLFLQRPQDRGSSARYGPGQNLADPSQPIQDRADLARGFQDAAIDVLVAKTAHAVHATGYTQAMIGGGVACNRALIAALSDRLAGRARVSVASPRLNTDNAAMIAAAGAWRLARGERSGWDLEPRDDLPLPGLVSSHSMESKS